MHMLTYTRRRSEGLCIRPLTQPTKDGVTVTTKCLVAGTESTESRRLDPLHYIEATSKRECESSGLGAQESRGLVPGLSRYGLRNRSAITSVYLLPEPVLNSTTRSSGFRNPVASRWS